MKFSALVLVAASGLALATKAGTHAPKESQHLDWDKVHEARVEAEAAGIDRRAAHPVFKTGAHKNVHAPKEGQHINWDKVEAARKEEAAGVEKRAAGEPAKDNRSLKYQANHEAAVATKDKAFDAQVAKKDAVRLAKVRSSGNAKAMRRRRRAAAREPTKDNRDLEYQSNHATAVATKDKTFDAEVAKKNAVRLAKVHSTGNAKAL